MFRSIVIFVFVLDYFVFVELTKTTKPSRKILIDHDGGADDAMAIFIAIFYEKYFKGPKIVGVTTTHGNVDEIQTYKNTQLILNIAGRRDIPIYRGCNSSFVYTPPPDYFFGQDGLGDNNLTYTPIAARPKHAAVAMVDLAKKYEGELIIVGLGSLTNFALAIKLDNLFPSRSSQMYLAAGKVYRKEEEYPEYNAYVDVEAYKIVIQEATPDKVTLISSSQVQKMKSISQTWREDILGAIPTQIMQAQNSFERISRENQTYWSFLDPMAMSFVLNSSLIEEYKFSKNDIILCGKDRGINTNDFEADPNVRLIYSSIGEPYKQFLLKVFSANCYICIKNLD